MINFGAYLPLMGEPLPGHQDVMEHRHGSKRTGDTIDRCPFEKTPEHYGMLPAINYRRYAMNRVCTNEKKHGAPSANICTHKAGRSDRPASLFTQSSPLHPDNVKLSGHLNSQPQSHDLPRSGPSGATLVRQAYTRDPDCVRSFPMKTALQ